MTDQFTFDNPIIPGSIWDKKSDFVVPVVSPVGTGPKGDKGDPTYFDDLTPKQLQEIYQAASFVGNRSLDATVVTSGASTTTIEIPWSDYNQFDMLFIDVNGLDLAEGDDYTISGNSIVLATPLPAGQDVHFRLLRYDVVDGDKNIVNTMGRKDYNTVAEMQADTELKPGDICHTLGFYAAGDGGAAWYVVHAHGVANSMDIIQLDNNLLAVLQITESYVTPEMFGAYGDGVHDDTSSIAQCFKNQTVMMNQGSIYLISSQIAASGNKCVIGNSATVLLATLDSDYNDYAIAYSNKNCISISNLSLVTQSHTLTEFSVPSGHSKATGETSSGWHGIIFRHCSNVSVSNCYFEGLGFGLAVMPGTYTSLEKNACKNINISGNFFYNVKDCYIFEYCNYVNFEGNKHILDIPASDGFHVYYLEAYVGDVTISNEITNCSPNTDSWCAYDFASYGSLDENIGRIISMSNVQAIAPRFFGTNGNCTLMASNCSFESNAVGTGVNNLIFIDKASSLDMRFNNCVFKRNASATNMILFLYAEPINPATLVFDSCKIEVARLMYFATDASLGTSYAIFKNCKLIANATYGITPIPLVGTLDIIGCDIEGAVGWTPSFITGQYLTPTNTSITNIKNCLFTNTIDNSPAAITGVISGTPIVNVFGCQMSIPNTASGGSLWRTTPTNKANNYTRYTADPS